MAWKQIMTINEEDTNTEKESRTADPMPLSDNQNECMGMLREILGGVHLILEKMESAPKATPKVEADDEDVISFNERR